MTTLINFLKSENSYTKKILFLGSLLIFLSSAAFLGLLTTIIGQMNINIVLPILLGPVSLYITLVIAWRSWIVLIFSRKINVVFAYNLGGINYKGFEENYDRYIKTVRNYINSYGLSPYIRVIKKQTDIQFKTELSAERKAELGMIGATLIIWGHATRRKGRTKFITKFSFEYVFPSYIKKELAKKMFSKIINQALGGGIFNLDKYETDIDEDIFAEHSIPTILFLLGLTSMTSRRTDTAIILFEQFREIYQSSNLLRKPAMGPALVQVNTILRNIYEERSRNALFNSPKDFIEAEDYARKVLNLKKDDFGAYIVLAQCYEENGNRPEAIKCNEMAAEFEPNGQHLTEFNKAYFCLSDGDFPEALKVYKSIPDETQNLGIVSMQRYFYEKYKDTKDLKFLFAEGYVVYRWQDQGEFNAKNILEEFIKESKDIDKYKILREEALKLVG